MTDTRQLAHTLIDTLPEAQLLGLVQFLESIVDPNAISLGQAPFEDEIITVEEEQAVQESRQWLRNNDGRGIAHEEAMRRLGLT
jgi:hypothetical protein